MPRVFPDISLEMKFKKLIDLSLYLPFDGDADDASGNGLTPSTESGAIIYPSWITPVVGSSAVQLAEATTNIILNPSIETNTTGYAVFGGVTIDRSADQAKFGTYSGKLTHDGAQSTLFSYATTLTNVVHVGDIWVWIPSATTITSMLMSWVDFTLATQVTLVAVDLSKRDQWQFLARQITPDAGDLTGTLRLIVGGVANGDVIYIDGLDIEDNPYPTPTCIGDMGTGHSWAGAAHASTSSRTVTELQYDDLATAISGKTKLTFAGWYQPAGPDVGNANRVIVNTIGADNDNRIYLAIPSTANDQFLVYINGGTRAQNIGPTSITDKIFWALTLDFDTDEYILYIYDSSDDTLYSSLNSDSLTAPTLSRFFVGRSHFASSNANGWLDELIVLDCALTASEVQTLYHNGLDGIAADGVWTNRWDDVIAESKVKASYGIKGFLPTQRVGTSGKMTFQLNNGENNSQSKLGLYSPGHANAQLGFEIGMPVRLKFEYNEIRYYKFYGTIREPKPLPGQYRKRVTSVTAVDFMTDMSEHKLDLLEVSVNSTSNQLVSAIIGNMTRQPNSSDIEVGQSIFAFAADGLKDEKTTALAGLQRTVLSEFGYAYTIGDSAGGGKFRYEDRHERVTNTTIEATLTEDEIATLDPVRTDKNLFNRVEAKTFPRDVGSSNEILYSVPNPVSIGPGNTETIIARYRDPNQESARISGTTMVTPVKDTDYKFGSSEGGGSNDMNDDLGVDVTFGANSAKIVLTNNAVSSGFLNLMQLRGLAIRLFDSATALALDSTSKLAYGDRPLNMSLLYQDSALEGQDFADVTLSLWKDPRNLVKSVGFWANQDATRLVDALEIEPGDRVSLSESLSAIDDEFFVNGVEFVIHPAKTIFCKWFPAPASDASFWLLGEVGFSEIGETTTLGF